MFTEVCFSEEEEELPLAAVAAIVEQEVLKVNLVVVDLPAPYKVPVVQEQAQYGVPLQTVHQPLDQVVLKTVQTLTVKEEILLSFTTRCL